MTLSGMGIPWARPGCGSAVCFVSLPVPGCSLILFVLSQTVQESSVATSFVPLMYELLIRQNVKDLSQVYQTSHDWNDTTENVLTP